MEGAAAGAGDRPPSRPTTEHPHVRVAILGLGQIGGSAALALRELPDAERPFVSAWSPAGRGPRAALSRGVVDAAPGSVEAAIAGADLVVLAAPAPACLTLLDALASLRRIVARADALGLPFVGGHPMAGREASGFEAADAALFTGRPWVLVPGVPAGERDVERSAWLAAACGGTVLRMDAAAHDRAVAAISHLPLVASAALVEAVTGGASGPVPDDWAAIAPLAAGGWAGMTRLARGEPAMGSGILETNADLVAERVRDLVRALESWLDLLSEPAGPEGDALRARLAAARDRLAER
jgi:prephenate dehydrogenase